LATWLESIGPKFIDISIPDATELGSMNSGIYTLCSIQAAETQSFDTISMGQVVSAFVILKKTFENRVSISGFRGGLWI